MRYIPRNFQVLIRNFIVQHTHCNIWGSMGIGKTPSTLEAIAILLALGEVERVLIFGPRNVAWSTWIGEVEKFFETFGHLRVARAIGTAQERINAMNSDHHILCINYENIPWFVEAVGDNWIWDMVVADESTRLKGTRVIAKKKQDGTDGYYAAGKKTGGSVRGKAIVLVARTKVKRWVNLTGSPAPNGLQDLYGQMYFIDGGKRLGRSSKAFEDRWFKTFSYDGMGKGYSPTEIADREIKAAIRDVTLTIDARDYFDIKEVIDRSIYFDLPKTARNHYRTMERDYFANLESHGFIETVSASGQRAKLLQFASGFAYTDPEGKSKDYAEIHHEKLDALSSIVEETNGENLLVRFHFKADLDRIRKRFPKAVFLGNGKLQEKMDAWNKGEIRMLLVHAKSAGHGLSLQHGGRILVDYSYDYNLEEDEQVIERIGPTRQMQSGYDRNVFRYRIVARDTLEEYGIIPALRQKWTLQEGLKNAMKLRAEHG